MEWTTYRVVFTFQHSDILIFSRTTRHIYRIRVTEIKRYAQVLNEMRCKCWFLAAPRFLKGSSGSQCRFWHLYRWDLHLNWIFFWCISNILIQIFDRDHFIIALTIDSIGTEKLAMHGIQKMWQHKIPRKSPLTSQLEKQWIIDETYSIQFLFCRVVFSKINSYQHIVKVRCLSSLN